MGAAADIHDRRRGIFTPDDEAVRMVFALTERERQVLVLIAGGKSTKETAAQLGISYKTADSHRSRILEKLGVHETASMVRYAIRSGADRTLIVYPGTGCTRAYLKQVIELAPKMSGAAAVHLQRWW